MCAYPLVGNEPFAVVLPDVIIDEYESDLTKDNLAAMINNYHETKHSQIMVEPVPKELVSSYGIADCHGQELSAGAVTQMYSVVEKPSVEEAPSNQSVVGRYVLSEKIWPLLAKTPLGTGGEIQLTDAIAMLLESDPVDAYCIKGRSHDCGNKLGYIQTFIQYAMRHKSLGNDEIGRASCRERV